jgi:glycosyltransferase involved in cell wall biosynthesis
MKKLSATIITRDEEANIARCLSALDFVDEIVVIDAQSEDRTVELAAKFTPHVHVNPWPGHIQQKNLAIERATGEWILALDADEEVTPELKAEIRAARLRDFYGLDGFYLPRRSLFMGRWIEHCGWRPDHHLRLFRKDRGRFGGINPHDIVKIDGRTGRFRHPLLHYTYPSLDVYLKRMNSYTSIAAGELARRDKPCRLSQLAFSPLATFIKMYVLKQGFRDGTQGLLLCILSGYYVLVKYLKLREFRENAGRTP